MQIPGRKFKQTGSDYRYSINGQEKESELNENITTAEYWEYDSRIVRRWNVDPVVKVYESPYLCFSNNPVWLMDPLGSDTIPASLNTSKSFGERMKALHEENLKRYQEDLVVATKHNAEEHKKPLFNFTSSVTLGSSFAFRGKLLGIGASINGTEGTDLDLIGVRDNQGVLLGTNQVTGAKPRKMLAGGVNYGGFGFGVDMERDANTSYFGNKKEGIVFKPGGEFTLTEKLEVPFQTWERKTFIDGNTGKVKKVIDANKTPLLHIKAAVFIGIELSVDINSRNLIVPAFPIDPYKPVSDETRLKPFTQTTFKKKP